MQASRQQGFTLIELLIVMVILGVLAAMVGPQLFSKVDDSKQKAAKVQIESLGTALAAYRLDVGRYPSRLEALRTNADNERLWAGPYLPKEVPSDPWGNAYQYRRDGQSEYEIISYGADGQNGGEGIDADISSRQ